MKRGLRASLREDGTSSTESMEHMGPITVCAAIDKHQVRSWEGFLEVVESELAPEG